MNLNRNIDTNKLSQQESNQTTIVTPVDQRGRPMLLTLNLATKRSSNFKTTQHLTNTSIRQNNKIGKKTEKELHHHL